MAEMKGVREFERALAQAKADVRREAMRACQTSAVELAERVKAAVGRGDARNGHIADKVIAYQKDDSTWAVKVDSEYAAPLEFGHKTGSGRAAPKKFFFPSVKVMNRKHGRKIRRWVRNVLRESGVAR